jgi:hypothetical protein
MAADRSQTARRLADQVRAEGLPRRERFELHSSGRSVRSCLLKDAVREAGHDPEDPDSAEHYWFESLDMIVIDLQTETDE